VIARSKVSVCGGRAGFAQERIGLLRWRIRLHADKWLEALRTGVVAGPLAERSFFLQLTGSDFAFENNFRIRRIRKTGDVAANHFDRLFPESPGEVEFADTRRHRTRRGKPNQRIAAEHDVYRHRLIFLEVFLLMNVSVLARADIDSGGVLILRHDPISADVHPNRNRDPW
jgi:hypothetical protein